MDFCCLRIVYFDFTLNFWTISSHGDFISHLLSLLFLSSYFLIVGNLEKLSHDFFVKKWQVRRFELDIPKKTLKYFVGDELKDEYYELSKIENVDAVSRDRPHRFVVFGKSKKSDNDNVSELHINSDSELVKKQWMGAIKQSISGGTQIDVESIGNIVVVERDTEWTSTDIEIGEKIGGHSYLVLYLENLNLFSQLLGIYSTYLLLIHLMPDSTEGPTSCGDTFFIYENPVTGICVGTEVCLIVVAIHLIIDVVFASIISNTIDFQKKAVDFEVDIENIYSSDNFGKGNVGAYILSQLALYMLVYAALLITGPLIDVMLSFLSLLPSWGQGLLNTSLSLSSALFDGIMALSSTISNGIVFFPLVNGVVNPEAFRGMLLSTFGILPWITEGLSRCLGRKVDSTFCGYFLLTEALNACVYLIVPFDEMNQSTLLVLNAISAGAAGVACYYKSLKIHDRDYFVVYAVPNVVFLLATTLPGSWYTICMSYLWLAVIARVLLTEIFGIFPSQNANDIPGLAAVFGFLVIGAIALINFLPFTCHIYNGFMTYSAIFNGIVNPEAFRGMLLSTFGILPWITEGLSRCSGQWRISFSNGGIYFLLTEALCACVYLIVPFDEMNQSTLLVLNAISAGAAWAGACFYRSLQIDITYCILLYAIPTVVFLLVTTLPGPWYTICMSYIWLAAIARVLLTEIFGIFPDGNKSEMPITIQTALYGSLVIGAIAFIYFIYDSFSWFMFSNDASSSTSRRLLSDVNEVNNPPSSSEIFYDTCYLGLSMVFALSTLVTLCRLTALNRSKVLSATWWEGFHLFGPIVAAFLFVAFSMNWTITEYLEPYNNVFTLVVCAIVYFMTPILIHAVFLPVFNCTINSFVIMLNPMGYLEPNETPLER